MSLLRNATFVGSIDQQLLLSWVDFTQHEIYITLEGNLYELRDVTG